MLEGDSAVFVWFARAIAFVSDDRAARVGELCANLVVTACFKLYFEQ